MTEATGLREQKKLETRRAISDAALKLTDGRRYADVTVAQIATAAGISRRTVSNYFTSKADCFAAAVGGEFITDVVRELMDQESGSTSHRLARAFKSVDRGYWENVRRLHQIALEEPDVAAAVAFAERTECDGLVDALIEASGGQIDAFRLRVTISAIGSCISVAVDHWLEHGAKGGTATLVDLVASSLDILDLAWIDPHLDLIRTIHQNGTT